MSEERLKRLEEDLRQFGVKMGCLGEAARKVAAEFGKLSSLLKEAANDDVRLLGEEENAG